MAAADSPEADLESLLGRIADDYTRRLKRGDGPTVDEYAARHPELAGLLAEILPAIRALGPADTPGPHDTPGRTAAGPPPPRLADYDVLNEVGRGGMGVVYRARHRALGRLVALKVLRDPDPADLERFRAEARAVARLQHPNVVQLFEVGEADGRPFLALEYVDGGSLADRVRGEPQPPRAAAALVQTLARAVACAHAAGVVHRDLKPANILLANDQIPMTNDQIQPNWSLDIGIWSFRPKVTDFGLAKRLDADRGQTQTGAVVGTPSYMAPEQAAGGRDVGPAADVYALGAILYELLTGRPPFKGPSVLETLELVRHADPAPPSHLQPGCPRDLETIALKCLHKDPARRYPTAAGLADDLGRFLAGRPVQARPVGRAERLARWLRRRPAVAASLGLGAVAALAVVALAVRLAYSWDLEDANARLGEAVGAREAALATAQEARGVAEQQHQEASGARADLAAALKRERALHYVHGIGLAWREWQANRIDEARRILDACPPDLRHWEWDYLYRQCHAELRAIRGHAGQVVAVAVSPDGRRIASASYAPPSGTAGFTWDLKVWDADTGRLVRELTGLRSIVFDLAFSPDGTRLASVGMDRTVRVWDPETGREVGKAALADNSRHVAFSPDGRRLAVAAGPRVHLFEVAGLAELFALSGHTRTVTALAFSPDGERLATGGVDRLVKAWDLRAQKELFTAHGHAGQVTAVAFVPGQDRIVSAGSGADPARGEVRLWEAADGRTAGPPVSFPFGLGTGPVFTADAARLVCATPEGVRVLDARTGRTAFTLRGGKTGSRVALTADGRRLVTGAPDGEVRVWPVANPEFLEVPVPEPVCSALAFSPDSARLAVATFRQAGGPGTGQARVRVVSADTAAGGPELRPTGPVLALAFGPDSGWLAAAERDAVRLMDPHGGGPPRTLSEFMAAGLAVSPDGRLLATAAHHPAVNPRPDVVLMPNLRPPAPGRAPPAIKLWRAADGQLLHVLPGQTSAAFSPDGRLLAGASDTAVRVWDVATAQEVCALAGPGDPVLRVQFVAGGRVVGFTHRRATVWDVETGREVAAVDGLKGPAFATPDGRRLVGLHDGSVRVWDVGVGRELMVLEVPARQLRQLALSPDGRRVAAWGTGGVTLWPAGPP